MIYDIFYVSKSKINNNDWLQFRSRFPSAQKIEEVDSFEKIKIQAFTKFFWVVWDDVDVLENFEFDYRIPEWDEQYIHVWKNGNFFDGIMLLSKNHSFSKKEFDLRYFVSNKKEMDQQASIPKQFDVFYIDTFEEYLEALDKTKTNMFWVVWNDVILDQNFTFDYQVSSYNQHITHIFLNGEHYDGVCLFSKHKPISRKEFTHRFFIEKKEIEIQASVPKKFDIFEIETYEDYLSAKEKSTTELFYLIPNEVRTLENFTFDLYFSHHNSYDRSENHVFKNKDISEIKYNGIMLLSKNVPVSAKEIEHRYLINKKEHDIVASELKPYDIIFISYNESNADENYKKLVSKFPRSKRIHGIKGIHNAHREAAKLSTTPMFYVVDGDADIVDEFEFDLLLPKWDRDTVHIWHSKNPINELEYGYGGVKLLPKDLVLNMDMDSIDMTTSISEKIRIMKEVSNYTAFNTDPFNTWKSAFREVCKLVSKSIDRNYQEETDDRIDIWCLIGKNRPYGEYAIAGARAGKKFGVTNLENSEELKKINDFDWLYERFKSEPISNQ